jgi:hypothetical protein
MKFLLLMATLLTLGATCASATTFTGLPRVYVVYPDGTFEHSPLKVRPTAIRLSEDGNGTLTNLTWSAWTHTSARATGLQEVRCFGGSTDPKCYPGRFGYAVPATVRLSIPVSTSRGVVFTVLKATRRGHIETVCLPPAQEC